MYRGIVVVTCKLPDSSIIQGESVAIVFCLKKFLDGVLEKKSLLNKQRSMLFVIYIIIVG